jgi:L-arabinose isomerase
MTNKYRLGTQGLFFEYYSGMPPDFRRHKEQWYHEVLGLLREHFDVIDGGLVDCASAARESAGRLAAQNIDVLLLIPMMAVKANVGVESSRIAGVSLVIWNAHESISLPPAYDAAALVSHSGNVGTLALTNALLREGRRFLLTTGHWQDKSVQVQIVEQVRSAAVATSLGRLKLGIIGEPFEGMLDISLDDDVLLHNGLNSATSIPLSVIQETFAGISDETLSDEVSCMKRTFSCERLTEDALRASGRLALALENVVVSNQLSGGAVNCHSAGWREDPRLGVLGCYAASRLAALGIPFACTGDLCTGLAMVIADRLSGTAFYCEIDLLDYANDEALLSNSGEMDYRYSSVDREELVPHSFYCAAAGVSAVTNGTVKSGPATLLALTPLPDKRIRVIAASGRVLDRKAKDLPVSNCVFKFDRTPVNRAFEEWCLAGANHHAVLMEGCHLRALRQVAELQKWEFIAIEEKCGAV